MFGILSIIGIPFAAEIYSFISAPLIELLPDGSSMIATEVASPFMAPIKLVLYVALLFSMPWLFYQIWMFIAPGLYKDERAFTAPLMLTTIILFFSGAAFAFFVVCPIIFKFFIFLIVGMLLTPPDIFSQLFLAIPMYILFEIGVLFARNK